MLKIVNKLFDLSSKNIIVAGGAGQIGFSFVEVLLDAGANVIIADIDTEMAYQKAKESEVVNATKEKLYIEYLDVSNNHEINKFYNKLSQIFNNIYGLINVFHYKGDTRKLNNKSSFFSEFSEYPEEAWNLVHDINLRGSFLMSQKVIPFLEKNGEGVIVNISSTYGIVSANKKIYGNSGINSPVAYATSKAGIINLTRYMATHLADKNIRVNCLSPGGVFNNQSDEFINNYSEMTPLKRMANSNDYQGAILFLISNASTYMTGANLIVDGGWTSW